MSVVVYRDGVMASDSRAYSGHVAPIGAKKKIHRLADGSLVGITSNHVGLPDRLLQWLKAGARDDDLMPADPQFSMLHVKPDGQVFYYWDSYMPTGPLEAEFFAIGSGEKYALGAMTAGCDAVNAAHVAIEHDIWCGGPVRALRLNPHLAG